jgi:hypothetical protein
MAIPTVPASDSYIFTKPVSYMLLRKPRCEECWNHEVRSDVHQLVNRIEERVLGGVDPGGGPAIILVLLREAGPHHGL